MKTAKLFQNGKSQAVRLPREFRLAGTEVYIKRQGKGVLLVPKEDPWKALEESLSMFSDDFMSERQQGPVDRREDI
jgi:antitoxin VapB